MRCKEGAAVMLPPSKVIPTSANFGSTDCLWDSVSYTAKQQICSAHLPSYCLSPLAAALGHLAHPLTQEPRCKGDLTTSSCAKSPALCPLHYPRCPPRPKPTPPCLCPYRPLQDPSNSILVHRASFPSKGPVQRLVCRHVTLAAAAC